MAQREMERVYKGSKYIDYNPRRVLFLTNLGKQLMDIRLHNGEQKWLRHLLTPSQKHSLKQRSRIKITERKYEIYLLLTKNI